MALEGLTEFEDNRVARKATSAFYSGEDSVNYYIRQPQSLCYIDQTTGHEVWVMSCTPNLNSRYHNDIGVAQWSADGKRFAFQSPQDTDAFDRAGFRVWWIVNTDGSILRPVIDGPARIISHNPYFHWSPQVPDVYYGFARNRAGISGLNEYDLYKCTVSDIAISRSLLISFPSAHGQLLLNKTLSGDGKKVIAMPWYENWNYPATVYPDGSAALDDVNGYIVDRNMDSSWGDTPTSYTKHHDQYYYGDGSFWFILPSTTPAAHSWWRLKVLGTAADGGSIYSFSAPDVFDEQWPENTFDAWGGPPDPFGCDYWSHFCPDRWGRYALFSAVDMVPVSPGIWDIVNHQWVSDAFGTNGCQHHQWSAFSDWFVSTRTTDRIFTCKYNDVNSTVAVCNPHARVNGGSSYDTLPRPGQSPDGTKVQYHSEFLNPSANSNDIFWAVAYFPHPPKITGVSKVGSNVRIAWDWDSDSRYTNRRWVDESTGDYIDPKETKAYHVWVSEDNVSWTELTTTGVAVGTEVYDYAQPNSTTRYYAVTQEEYSGLESRSLSNRWQITLDGSGAITTNVQATAYPADPKADASFYTTNPEAPSSLSVTEDYDSIPGHNRLTWTEPNDSSVRYYNVYYSSSNTPSVAQANRIASLPVGTSAWVDWLASPSAANHYYVMTSVDRLGNEGSLLAAPSDIHCEGETSPVDVMDSTPEFQAYVTPDSANITKIQVQVSETDDFSGALAYDSGMLTLDTEVSSAGWTDEISYGD